jgi:hypothetical protein
MPGIQIADTLEINADRQGRSWAHVSGWALMSGTRRTISCVVPCLDHAAELAEMLPDLSDTLTECGYPWETIVVDGDRSGQTQGVMAAWVELPGFRSLSFRDATGPAQAVAKGLFEARGDAVIVADVSAPRAAATIASMILRWESGATLVCALPDARTGITVVKQWDEASLQQRATHDSMHLPAETTTFSLMDRRLVDRLIHSG